MDDFEMNRDDLNENKFLFYSGGKACIFDVYLTLISESYQECITKNYTESKNCKRDISFADQISKSLEILIFERHKNFELLRNLI